MNKILLAIMAMMVIFSSCEKDELKRDVKNSQPETISSEEIAINVANLLKEKAVLNDVVANLKENENGGSLESILELTAPEKDGVKAKQTLTGIVERAKILNNRAEETGVVKCPELWMFKPEKSFKSTDVLVACVPEGDEDEWEKITAYDSEGNVVFLDPEVEPDVPVIVVELNGRESMRLTVGLMNKELRKYGLQTRRSEFYPPFKSAGGLETTKLKKVSLKKDKEPWIKGKAEIFAITSGLRGNENIKEPEIAIVEMPYIKNQNIEYYPNQIVLFWDDYDYAAANIQFYEHDSGYNYKELVSIIVGGVFEITGVITGEIWVSALGIVASAIIMAMPDQWFTDDDDYLDSFYTIEKNKTYINYYGAGNNAKVTLEPYFVPAN